MLIMLLGAAQSHVYVNKHVCNPNAKSASRVPHDK